METNTNLPTSTSATPPPRPVNDLSARAIDLARMIEHLPPGNYDISLQKQEFRRGWNVEIVRTEKIATVQLPKYNPE